MALSGSDPRRGLVGLAGDCAAAPAAGVGAPTTKTNRETMTASPVGTKVDLFLSLKIGLCTGTAPLAGMASGQTRVAKGVA